MTSLSQGQVTAQRRLPALTAVVELLKPITWFAPMWALGCGVVSSGVPVVERWPLILMAILLAGPLVCGTSQAVNDWFDRHVDAINEPDRPIPSGRVPGRWGLYIAIIWSAVAAGVGATLGPWVFGAALIGLALAWGVQRAAISTQKERLVGQRGGRGLLRGPAVVHRRRGDDRPSSPMAGSWPLRRCTASGLTASWS